VPSTTVEIRAKDKTSRAFDSVNKAIGGMKTGVLAIGTAIAGVGVAFGAWVNSMRDSVDRIGKVSSAVSVGSETLQKWQYTAGQAGLETEAFNKSLLKFTGNLGKAGAGAKAQGDAFKALNINIRNADGTLKGVEELLPEVATKFQILGDDVRATQIAVDLFGGKGAELINFLRSGKDGLERFGKALEIQGGVVEDKGVRATEQFNDRLDDLKNKFKNLFTPVIEVANKAIAPFVEEAERAKMTLPQLNNEIQAQINKLVKQRDSLKDTTKESKSWVSILSKGARASTVSKASIQQQIDVLAKQRTEIQASIEAMEERFAKEKKALEQTMKLVDVVDDASKKETDLKNDIYIVNDAIETQSGLVKNLSVNYEELLVQKQNQIDKNAELFQDEKDFLDDLEKEYQKKDFAYAKMVANRIASDNKMQEEATKSSLNAITSLSAGVKDESDDLFYLYQATSIGQAIMSTHESATKALTAGPYLGPIMAGIIYGLGMANVNKIRKEKPPSQRYMGGNVSAGKQYLVGERGPEILQMGRSGGNIIPNDKMGGGTNVMINISAVDARGIDSLLNERKDTLVGIINQSLQRQTRRAI
jgi:hypothetical protein